MKFGKQLLSFTLIACVLVTIESCERIQGCTDVTASNYNPSATYDNGTCKYNGVATFYFDQNGPNATVNVNGQTAQVTANYQTGAPTCGTSAVGCANFTLPVGNYAYTASSPLSSWSGQVAVTANGCALVNLQQTSGSVTFFTESANYGTITVTITGGATGQVTAVQSAIPLCGASGCATFNLVPGTYSYTAVASIGGTTWGPTAFTVTTDGCLTLQF
jgi:hypothetical protein